MRAQGDDPAHGGEAAQRRGKSNRQHQLAVVEWNNRHPQPDPQEYKEEILPKLADVTLERIADATGLSLGYCSFIRRGLKTPHARHWLALASLVDGAKDDPDAGARVSSAIHG